MTWWLVTGAGGMLGTDLVAALTSRGEPVTGMDRASLDITDAAAVTDTRGRAGQDSPAVPGGPAAGLGARPGQPDFLSGRRTRSPSTAIRRPSPAGPMARGAGA